MSDCNHIIISLNTGKSVRVCVLGDGMLLTKGSQDTVDERIHTFTEVLRLIRT